MATKGVNPFAKFEKSSKDKEPKGMKEGSAAEEALDAKQAKGMAGGGKAKCYAKGGAVRDGIAQRGKTVGKVV